MAYTKIQKNKYKKHFIKSTMVDSHIYKRLLHYDTLDYSNAVILELHLRNKIFKKVYEISYRYILQHFKKNKKFPFNGYQKLNKYQALFSKYGYCIFDITRFIYSEICVVNVTLENSPYNKLQSNFEKSNIYETNSSIQRPFNSDILYIKNSEFNKNIFSNTGESQYTVEYDQFISKFDIYKYNFKVPTNHFYMNKNSINVNIFLHETDDANQEQLERILQLIKQKKNNTINTVHKLIKMNSMKLINLLYMFDQVSNKMGDGKTIAVSQIQELTIKYLNRRIEGLKSFKQHKVLKTINALKRVSSKLVFVINKLNGNNDIDIKTYFRFFYLNKKLIKTAEEFQLVSILKTNSNLANIINMHTDFQKQIDKQIEKEQLKETFLLIEKDPDNEIYYQNNYREIKIPLSSIDFKNIFSTYNQNEQSNQIKRIESILNTHNNQLIKYFNEKKSGLANHKTETLNKYINNIKECLKELNLA